MSEFQIRLSQDMVEVKESEVANFLITTLDNNGYDYNGWNLLTIEGKLDRMVINKKYAYYIDNEWSELYTEEPSPITSMISEVWHIYTIIVDNPEEYNTEANINSLKEILFNSKDNFKIFIDGEEI